MITAIIINYKRPANVREIIPALRKQTVKPKIVLIDNGHYSSLKNVTGINDEPDDIWKSPFNAGPFQRYLIAKNYDGWLYFNDDDVIPNTDDYLERMVNLAQDSSALMVGVRGRNVNPEDYYQVPDATGWVNVVKGMSMLIHRDSLSNIRIPPPNWLLRNDDIWASLEVGRGRRLHWVDKDLNADLRDLPQKNTGLCHEPEHYKERSLGVKQWYEGSPRMTQGEKTMLSLDLLDKRLRS